MPGYTSQYVPIEKAIKQIAEHHFGGDETAAWRNVQIAIDEGAITTASGNSAEDMLSYIVAGVVKSGTRRNSPERNEPPAGTWLRRELEEVYGQIFAEDGGTAAPTQPADKQTSYAGRRPASQSQAEKIWEAFDERQNALTFNRGELAHIAGEIGEATGYKQNTVEKLIRRKYRDLEENQKQNST